MDLVTNDVLIQRDKPALNLVNQTSKTVNEEHSHCIGNFQSYRELCLTFEKHLSLGNHAFCRWPLKISAHTLKRSMYGDTLRSLNWSHE